MALVFQYPHQELEKAVEAHRGFSCWCGTQYGRAFGCALHTPMTELLPIYGVTESEWQRQLANPVWAKRRP